MDELAAITRRQKAQEARSRISIGDQVRVYFENVEWISGTVRSIPQATGDCWVVEDDSGYELHYIQTFARMTKGIS